MTMINKDDLYSILSYFKTKLLSTTGQKDGNDNNIGTSSAPFATINKAISMIPQIVNHIVHINIASGSSFSSNDILNFNGYCGSGTIIIIGSQSNPTSCIIPSVSISNCNIPISISGIQCNAINTNCINIKNSIGVIISYCICDVSSVNSTAVSVSNYSKAYIRNCTLSNRTRGIFVSLLSEVLSSNNTGSNNIYGIEVEIGSVIRKYDSSQPLGTTSNEHIKDSSSEIK